MVAKSRYSVLRSPPNEYGETAIWFEKTQTWQTQPKPYKVALPFSSTVAVVQVDSNPFNIRHDVSYATVPPGSLLTAAQNKAYSQLKEQFSEQQQWANNFLEYKKTVSMISDRALQLYRFTVALRRLDFGRAFKAIGISPRGGRLPRRFTRPWKNFGDLWLEFHFGWEPLVKDIGLGVETLVRFDPGSKVLRARATVRDQELTRGPGGSFDHLQWRSSALYGMTVRFENPNLAMANELGFVNPLSILWENVPFSFVVDWFVNIGDCLASITDFSGVSIYNKFNTSKVEGLKKSHLWVHGGDLNVLYVKTTRTPGSIPGPVLAVKPFNGLSVTRAATSVALLLKGLKG
jgi:hypothetical protein